MFAAEGAVVADPVDRQIWSCCECSGFVGCELGFAAVSASGWSEQKTENNAQVAG